MASQGWIKLHREIKESALYENFNARVLFIHLLLTVCHEDRKYPIKGKDEVIERGSIVTSIGKLSKEVGISIQQTRTALEYLEVTNRITNKTTNKFSVIQVQNWDKFQNDNKQNNKQDNKQITTKQEYEKEKEYLLTEIFQKEKSFCPPHPQKKIDFSFYLDVWNSGDTPRKIIRMTEKRKAKIQARLNDNQNFQEDFKTAVHKINCSDFLSGVNDRGWKCTFDWMIKNDSNYTKVLEGDYDNNSRRVRNDKPQQRASDGFRDEIAAYYNEQMALQA